MEKWLVTPSVVSDDGRMNENGYPYTGMMRFDVRVQLEEDLKSMFTAIFGLTLITFITTTLS